jgi:hypothetical protein
LGRRLSVKDAGLIDCSVVQNPWAVPRTTGYEDGYSLKRPISLYSEKGLIYNDSMVTEISKELAEALAQLPDVTITGVKPEMRVHDRILDVVLHGEVKGRAVRFLVEIKTGGYPRDVQHAIGQIADLKRLDGTVADLPLFAAPAISEAGREMLRRHQIGYWDASGSVYIDLPWALYLIDRPVPAGRPRPLRDVYRGSTAQVLHALLLEPGRRWHLSELAEQAGTSVSTAHQVGAFLEVQLWMEKEGKGPQSVRVLRQPGALLDAWAETHSLATYEAHRFHRWTRQPHEGLPKVADALASLGVEYALTLSSGAQLVAPHVTDAGQAWILVPASAMERLDEVARASDLQPVDEGENVTFLLTRERSPLLFRREMQGLCVASDVQLYLDLWAWPRRGREQARHLRAERLDY